MTKRTSVLVGVMFLALVVMAFTPQQSPVLEYRFQRVDGGGDLQSARAKANELSIQGWRLMSSDIGSSIQGRQEMILVFSKPK